ncbi:MAG: DUF4388 domain-containing protein [Thermodesulfovibrionia bacterium]|nr:DUF4388 domain-containing protein [Thermodesulfovibrionia bacterium]
MKKARLDEILLRLGIVNEDQLKKALLRQKSRRGKLGSHLLYYQFITEDQLVHALEEQFNISGIQLSNQKIHKDVLQNVPVDLAEEHVAMPFRFDSENGILYIAIADPENKIAVAAIRRASGASTVITHVAPEMVIHNMIASLYRGKRLDQSINKIIDLPDLFENEAENQSGLLPAQMEQDSPKKPQTSVLMFTKQVFLKNVLPSIFEREGLQLSVVSTTEQLAEMLQTTPCQRMLVSEDVQEELERFVAEGRNRTSFPEIAVFRTVTSALMENPVPYSMIFRSLLMAVRHIAERQSSGWSWSPPYALISNDVREVGRCLRLRPIVVDGLQIASHLLTPITDTAYETSDLTSSSALNIFRDLEKSIQIAQSLNFPWDISECLRLLNTVIPAPKDGTASTDPIGETTTATWILALVWYRHLTLRHIRGDSEDIGVLKSKIRQQAGRLAPSSIVEVYIRVLEQSSGRARTGIATDIFIVGDIRSVSSNFVEGLRHHGFRTVEIKDFQAFKPLYLRRRPDAILINVDESSSDAGGFCQYVRKDMNDSVTALFAITHQDDLSFFLNLVENGFSDVFALPLKHEVIIARISNTLSTREREGGQSLGPQGFRATFNDLSFVDLIQALAGGAKNVRILIENSSGEKADIFVRQGQIVYATCGNTTSVDAVYKVIRWRDDGSFRIVPTNEFPSVNVSVSNESILLEGCRLMDESDAENSSEL